MILRIRANLYALQANQVKCPSVLQLVDLMLDLFNTGYTLTQMENAMLASAGPDTIDPIIAEIFDCLEDPIPTTSTTLSVSSSQPASKAQHQC